MKATAAQLSEAELVIINQTRAKALATLDEDELLDLLTRVRRARTKYVGQYRRQASAAVPDTGARGQGGVGNQRARDRAEVFEQALSRVSKALAKAAAASAETLKVERLAAAQDVRGGGPEKGLPAPKKAVPADKRPPRKSSGRIKKDAHTKAAGARRQAKRDAR